MEWRFQGHALIMHTDKDSWRKVKKTALKLKATGQAGSGQCHGFLQGAYGFQNLVHMPRDFQTTPFVLEAPVRTN
jgi:hypothetical protein